MTARSVQWLAAFIGVALAGAGCLADTALNLPCSDPDGNLLPTADASQRVDLSRPSFGASTEVTNPLFPIAALERAVLLGNVDGVPLRVETTLLPYTRLIDDGEEEVENLVSQYVAWVGRRLHEVAIDWYAQADDGAVWYFGEDVFNYEDGVIADTDGTWLAGREGPAAMIMPASPAVGDVWRPENICGLVFEEVSAQATGVNVNGPAGPVAGALVVEELHLDGTREDKIFAPGYGEFSTGSGTNLEALAVAVPADRLSSPLPSDLQLLGRGAARVFDAAGAAQWSAASDSANAMAAAWSRLQTGNVPPMLRTQMDGAIAALVAAVGAQQRAAARQAAVDVALAGLDLQLRHRPRTEIDVALMDVWARQLIVDAEAGDAAAVQGDAASLKWIRDRIADDVSPDELPDIDGSLKQLGAAVRDRDLMAAAAIARRLSATAPARPAGQSRAPVAAAPR